MKKLTAIFLAVLMVIGCMSIMAVSATETATITVDGKAYTVDVGKTLTYTVNLKTVHMVTNGEFYLGYPQSVLTIANDDAFDFPVVGKSSVTYNYTDNIQNEFRFNWSKQSDPVDFTNGGTLVTIAFNVTAAGTGSIGFINEQQSEPGQLTRETVLSWVDTDYSIKDEIPNATFTETLSGYNPDVPPTEATQPTEVTSPTGETQATQPTEAPETKISFSVSSKSIYVGDTATVKAKVTNGVGDTKYTSSNTSVATVNASTGKVTGKKAGSVTIKATNNGKSASYKLTVKKKANTITAKGKTVTAKTKKNTTFTKAQAFTVKNAKGAVTFKKSSGNAKITVAKAGKVTVKKGLKKGTYKVKVKVTAAGNTTYKAKTVSATVTVKVK